MTIGRIHMFAPKFRRSRLQHALKLLAATALTASFATATIAQEVVAGPGAEPECFAPWTKETKYFQFKKKEGPYRIALANGFIGNTWRIQMIKTAKAYAEQPDVKAKLKEFKVVSTGEDARSSAGGGRQLHCFWLRRDRRQRPEPDGVHAGHQAREEGRRRAGRLRQHARQQGGDQRQRRPEGPRRSTGPTGW